MGARAKVGQPETLLEIPGGWVKPHTSGLWESPPASWRQPPATSGRVASSFREQTAPSIPGRPCPSDEVPRLGVRGRRSGPTLGCRSPRLSPESAADLLCGLRRVPPPSLDHSHPTREMRCQARKTTQQYHFENLLCA